MVPKGKAITAGGLASIFIFLLLGGSCYNPNPSIARPPAGPPPAMKIPIKAKTWEFLPPVISAKVGIPVELTVTSVDVDHGIEFTDLDIPSERAPAGRSIIVRFIPSKPGTYHFKCAVLCGTGHENMTGLLIVE